MCRVDALAQTLVVGEHIRIKFLKEDVARIFGIPCGGRLVGGDRSLEELIDRDYGEEMSDREVAGFKVAFVIYVMSTMLSPGSRFDYAGVDYWDCLRDPDDIGSYDWCDYVIRKLIDAVVKMKNDLNATGKVPNITGCSLFLQVIYLDSIDLGVLSMDHTVCPRIRFFGPDRMKGMIRSDTIRHSKDPKDRVFGKSKLLPGSKVCYSWAECMNGTMVGAKAMLKQSLWEATCALARLFDMSDEEAAPLFNVVAGIDLSTGSRITAAVTSFLEPVVRGRNKAGVGQLAVNGQGPDIDKAVGGAGNVSGEFAYCSNGKRYADVNQVMCDMPLDGHLAIKKMRFGRECTSSYAPCNDVKDPWFLGFKFRHSSGDAARYLTGIALGGGRGSGKGIHVLNMHPKFVDLVSEPFERQMLGEVEIEGDIVDGVLRCLKERDSVLYCDCGSVRWRHFVESNFMGSLLGGTFDASSPVVMSNFNADVIGYDAGLCKMLFFPARLPDRWVCYAWRFDVDMIFVFDPLCRSDEQAGIYEFHVDTCKVLRHAVSDVDGLGWSGRAGRDLNGVVKVVDVDAWLARVHCSGLACLYFCSMFDGETIRGLSEMDDIVSAAPVLVAEALDPIDSGHKDDGGRLA
ncbi:unnamed protein product [Urochloa humidicola]